MKEGKGLKEERGGRESCSRVVKKSRWGKKTKPESQAQEKLRAVKLVSQEMFLIRIGDNNNMDSVRSSILYGINFEKQVVYLFFSF